MRMIKEKDLIENKDVRESLITRVEVLDRVKELNTLADTDYMTTRQVAEFYEVDMNVVQQIWSSNRGEIDFDGVVTINYNDLDTIFNEDVLSKIEKKRGKAIIEGVPLSYSYNTFATVSAVIKMAFLLRDSSIAKQVVKEFTKEFPEEACQYLDLITQKRYEEDMYAYLVATFGKEHIKKQTNCEGYLIDFVLYDYIAIEVDENGHSGYIQLYEEKREGIVKKHYKLFRYDAREGKYLSFIAQLLNYLQQHNNKGYFPVEQAFKAFGVANEDGMKHINSMRGEFLEHGLIITPKGEYYLDGKTSMLFQMTYSGSKTSKMTRDYIVNREYNN